MANGSLDVTPQSSSVPNPRKQMRITRTRTGCVTCKSRRVKCDESKPECKRCTSLGLICDGYRIPQTIVFDVCRDPQERRSYHFFQDRAAKEIGGFFGAPFWAGLTLQQAYIQPAVRHAVVAIGAFFESFESSLVEDQRERARSWQIFSFQQASKAIRLLTNPFVAPPTEVVLISCILFICLEELHCGLLAASTHLRSGLDILQGWVVRRKNINSQTTAAADLIEDHIRPLLKRLSLQYGPLNFALHVRGGQIESTCQSNYSVPVSFSNLREANECLSDLIEHLLGTVESDATIHGLHQCADYAPIISTRLHMLQNWLKAFLKCAATGEHRSLPAGESVVVYLKIRHRIASVLIRALPFSDEMVFDRFTDDFRFIVTTTEEYRAAYSHVNHNIFNEEQIFAFESRLLWPLCITALHCRNPVIRRQANHLLFTYDYQEGPWSSLVCAQSAEKVLAIEENGINSPQSEKDIPRANRISLTVGKGLAVFIGEDMNIECLEPILSLERQRQTSTGLMIEYILGEGKLRKRFVVGPSIKGPRDLQQNSLQDTATPQERLPTLHPASRLCQVMFDPSAVRFRGKENMLMPINKDWLLSKANCREWEERIYGYRERSVLHG